MHMVKYTVKPDRVAENEQQIQELFDELRSAQRDGLQYTVLKLDDGVTFIHLISHEGQRGHMAERQRDALRALHAGLRDRCDEPPTRSEVTVIGSLAPIADA